MKISAEYEIVYCRKRGGLYVPRTVLNGRAVQSFAHTEICHRLSMASVSLTKEPVVLGKCFRIPLDERFPGSLVEHDLVRVDLLPKR